MAAPKPEPTAAPKPEPIQKPAPEPSAEPEKAPEPEPEVEKPLDIEDASKPAEEVKDDEIKAAGKSIKEPEETEETGEIEEKPEDKFEFKPIEDFEYKPVDKLPDSEEEEEN